MNFSIMNIGRFNCWVFTELPFLCIEGRFDIMKKKDLLISFLITIIILLILSVMILIIKK